MDSVVGIIPAGGSGERLGADRPKAFVVCAGRPLLEWSLRVLEGVCDRVIVAAPEGFDEGPGRVRGGDSRSASVRNALAAAPEATVAVVHDAARPLVTRDLVERCLTALEPGVDGAIAAAPLTDNHVHLRPDEDDSTAARYFTQANVDRYREAAEERGIDELGVAEHVHRFVQSLDLWTHPWYRHWAKDDLDEYCDFLRDSGLRVGIEADFLLGREDRVANLLDGRPWDYVVGSIHFLADEAIDLHGVPDWEQWDVWRSADPEKVWARYFDTLGEAARTGMFDILAHPDLVKVWGPRVPVP